MNGAVKFVADAAILAPAVVYEPENIDLDHYTFVPWVRVGLAAQIAGPPVGVRATVAPAVTVSDADGSEQVGPDQPLALIGPGDIIAIDPSQIVRRYPSPGAFNVDPSYLAHVEFDRPEFPWLFTPFPNNGDRLDPWIALIVIATDRLPQPAPTASLTAYIDVVKKDLQPLDDRWAWAHAQVSGLPAGGASVPDRLTDAYAPANLSRLLCPRKLEPSRTHLACVVPAYDCGVRSGLGKPGGTLAPAWTRAAGDDNDLVRLPVYAYWQFTTGPETANFEALAKKLHGIAAPWQVGRRIVDASKPRGGITLADTQGTQQLLEGPLRSPQAIPEETSSKLGVWSVATRNALRAALNEGRPADPTAAPDDLPRVAPRVYAQYQRGAATVDAVGDVDWFQQLNTSPMDRIVSGLGTRVVQKDQEPLMQAAWAQVGDLEAANQMLTRAQFARYVAEALHRNHLSRLDLAAVAQITRPVHGKVRLGGSALTIAGTATRSATPPAALSGTFRRLSRVRGPLVRIAARSQGRVAAEAALRTLVASDLMFHDLRRPHIVPEGVRHLTPEAINRFPKAHLARLVGTAPDLAPAAFASAIRPLESGLTSADLVQRPLEQWKLRQGQIDVAATGARRAMEQVERVMSRYDELDAPRADALGRVLAGVAATDAGDAANRAQAAVRRLAPQLGEMPASSLWQRSAASAAVPSIGPQAGILRLPADGAARTAAPRRVTAYERLNTGAAAALAADLGAVRTMPIAAVASEFREALHAIDFSALPSTPDLPLLSLDKATVLAELHPRRTLTRYVRGRIEALPKWLPGDWFDNGRVDRIMAAPRFERPMYEALDAYDRGWLIPGLGEIDETDFVTVLETNPRFIEAFLIGLSDEFGRELLWRGYPTDARGTYFRRFWSSAADELTSDIHLFPPSRLETHIAGAGGTGVAVLAIRGELIRHYPDAIVLALRKVGAHDNGAPKFGVAPTPYSSDAGAVLFHASLPPDIVLVGFRLSMDDIRSETTPWWFVIAEHPTAPRFGLDADGPPVSGTVKRNDLNWSSLPRRHASFLSTVGATVTVLEPDGGETTQWNAATLTGAGAARVLLQNPFRAAWHASKLLTPAKG